MLENRIPWEPPRRAEAQVFDLGPLRAVTHAVQEQPLAQGNDLQTPVGFAHWPADGEVRIGAARIAVTGIANHWRRVVAQLIRLQDGRPSAHPSQGHRDSEFDRALAPAQSELQEATRAIRVLADEYERAGAWLGNEIRTLWHSAGRAGLTPPDFGSSLGEYHRIVARDWLSADMNFTIARLLRRATVALQVIRLEGVGTDLQQAQHCQSQLDGVEDALRSSATVAGNYASFVQGVDHHWQALRHQIDQTLAH